MDAETLSEDELAYHSALVAKLKAGNAAWQSWSAHLQAKYGLADGDGITEAGEVVRSAQRPAPAGIESPEDGASLSIEAWVTGPDGVTDERSGPLRPAGRSPDV